MINVLGDIDIDAQGAAAGADCNLRQQTRVGPVWNTEVNLFPAQILRIVVEDLVGTVNPPDGAARTHRDLRQLAGNVDPRLSLRVEPVNILSRVNSPDALRRTDRDLGQLTRDLIPALRPLIEPINIIHGVDAPDGAVGAHRDLRERAGD